MMSRFAVASAIALAMTAPVGATSIVYNDFSSLSGLQLNGNTDNIHTCDPSGNTGCDAITDNLGREVLRLTNTTMQSGSAFSLSTIALTNSASFSAAFQFRMTNPAGISDGDGQGADGIVFVVQTVSNTSGGAGVGIGYQGLLRSVGVEFDTYNNGSIDANSGNHVGINTNGNIASSPLRVVPTTDPGTGDPFGRLNNGADWYAWVDYNGVTDLLEVRLSNAALRPLNAYLSTTIDLVPILNSVNAYVGFTSGTGAASNYHDIISFQFNDDFAPIGAPAPAAIALLGLGLIGLGAARRRA